MTKSSWMCQRCKRTEGTKIPESKTAKVRRPTNPREKLCIGKFGCKAIVKAERDARKVPAAYTMEGVFLEDMLEKAEGIVPSNATLTYDQIGARIKLGQYKDNVKRNLRQYVLEVQELERLEAFEQRADISPTHLTAIEHYAKKLEWAASNKKQYREHRGVPIEGLHDLSEPGWKHRLHRVRVILADVPDEYIEWFMAQPQTQKIGDREWPLRKRVDAEKVRQEMNWQYSVDRNIQLQKLRGLAGFPPTADEYAEYKVLRELGSGDAFEGAELVRSTLSASESAAARVRYIGKCTSKFEASKIRSQAQQADDEHTYAMHKHDNEMRLYWAWKARERIEAGTMGTRAEEMPLVYGKEVISKLSREVYTTKDPLLPEPLRADDFKELEDGPFLIDEDSWVHFPSFVLDYLDTYLETGEDSPGYDPKVHGPRALAANKIKTKP